jgi:hypothetical protein
LEFIILKMFVLAVFPTYPHILQEPRCNAAQFQKAAHKGFATDTSSVPQEAAHKGFATVYRSSAPLTDNLQSPSRPVPGDVPVAQVQWEEPLEPGDGLDL